MSERNAHHEAVVRELVAAATDAAEELYIAMQYSRRPAVRERHARLVAALEAVRTIDD
jgi:hypothetical protein